MGCSSGPENYFDDEAQAVRSEAWTAVIDHEPDLWMPA